MAEPAESRTEPRWVRRFESPATFSQDIDPIGSCLDTPTALEAWRRDPARTADYVLRRLLVAWRSAERLRFPFEIVAEGVGAKAARYTVAQADEPSRTVDIAVAGADAEPASFLADLRASQGEPHELTIFLDTPPTHALPRSNAGLFHLLHEHPVRVNVLFPDRAVLSYGADDETTVWLATSYETDYAGWAFNEAAGLRYLVVPGHDFTNIAEELEDLGRRERRAVQSQLERLLAHLLKWAYQPAQRSGSWRATIREARKQITRLTSESPSLKRGLQDWFLQEYGPAREFASDETGLPRSTFPEQPPFTLEQALDPDFLPDTPASDEE